MLIYLRPWLLALAVPVALAGCRTPSAPEALGETGASGSASATVQTVVAAATAFEASLTPDQRAALTVALTTDNADNWSNFPVGVVERNGLQLGSLTEEQREAALAVARAALSQAGFATFEAVRAADAYLGTQPDDGPQRGAQDAAAQDTAPRRDAPPNGGPPQGARPGGRPAVQFSADVYSIAFLGTPSTTAPWMLQLGGHHYAVNFGFGGRGASPTPFFVGTEPLAFTLAGETYAPMAERSAAMRALFEALTPAQTASAQIPGSFRDVLLGPGQDFTFPQTQGVAVSSLSTEARTRVAGAIRAWVADTDAATAAPMLAAYTSDAALDQTTIGWAGGTGLDAPGGYVRIDGPRVWVEISAQSSRYQTVHYHSIWRDKALDYGGVFL